MKIAKEYSKSIFCLEGNWNNDLRDEMSIKPTLDYLKVCFKIKNIYRNCTTKEQFLELIAEYKKKEYNEYSILYLAFHGRVNEIILGKDIIDLDVLEEENYGLFTNKIIHFGSCSTLNMDKRRLLRFVRNTNALCLSGYKTDVDFNKSAVLDILYFEKWQYYKDVRCVERDMVKEYKELSKLLKFTMIYD